jgi:hypothetical protein
MYLHGVISRITRPLGLPGGFAAWLTFRNASAHVVCDVEYAVPHRVGLIGIIERTGCEVHKFESRKGTRRDQR